jgi:hypothetical protein
MDHHVENAASNGSNERFLAIWGNAIQEYSDRTGHDLSKLRSIRGVGDFSATMAAIEEGFKNTHYAGQKKARDALKSYIMPLQAISSIASSAVSLTPFTPAAAIFGAGMNLIGKPSILS